MFNDFSSSELSSGFGLTETSPATHFSPSFNGKIGSVGGPLSKTLSKVIDSDTGESLGPNQQGELCVMGPQVMKGYYNNPKATEDCLDSSGWLHTGDVAYYDDDRHFHIVGRFKELIKVKGLQVNPSIQPLDGPQPKRRDTKTRFVKRSRHRNWRKSSSSLGASSRCASSEWSMNTPGSCPAPMSCRSLASISKRRSSRDSFTLELHLTNTCTAGSTSSIRSQSPTRAKRCVVNCNWVPPSPSEIRPKPARKSSYSILDCVNPTPYSPVRVVLSNWLNSALKNVTLNFVLFDLIIHWVVGKPNVFLY